MFKIINFFSGLAALLQRQYKNIAVQGRNLQVPERVQRENWEPKAGNERWISSVNKYIM